MSNQNSTASRLQNHLKHPQNLPALNHKMSIPKTAHPLLISTLETQAYLKKLLFWISPVGHFLHQVLKHVLLKREPYVRNGCIYPK